VKDNNDWRPLCFAFAPHLHELFAGMRSSDFVGTAPRAKVGKYIVQNVSFESPSSSPSEPQPMDQFRHSAGVVWAEVRAFRTPATASVHRLDICWRVYVSH
jgi:hypothetical protein